MCRNGNGNGSAGKNRPGGLNLGNGETEVMVKWMAGTEAQEWSNCSILEPEDSLIYFSFRNDDSN